MKSILLIDDDPSLSRTLTEYFDPNEFRLDTMSDAPGSLEYILSNNPDVVLLDVNLPSVSGLELLKQIRSIADPPPVIIISGYVSTDSAIQAMKEGAYEYVTKPFHLEQLLRTINKATEEVEKGLPHNNLLDLTSPVGLAPAGESAEIGQPYREIIGVSDEIVEIAKMIGQVAVPTRRC